MEWEIYPTTVQGKLGLMLVNMEFQTSGHRSEWPHLNWFRVGYEADTQGFPVPSAQSKLEEVADFLVHEYQDRGALVGRLSVDGRREFFVYASDPDAKETLASLQERFPLSRFDARASDDPNWDVYLGFICPDPVQLQRLASHKGMQALQEQGDVVNIPRPVLHAAAFLSQEASEEFGAFVEELGFEVTHSEEIEDESAIRPFVLRFLGNHPVDVVGIERCVMPCFQKARELGGEYGGWQCSPILVS